MVRHDIFDSLAFKSLSTVERSLWLEIMRRFNGYNNGNIPLSCLEAAKFMGVSKNTANRAFKGLQAAGFVKVATPSSFHVKVRRATRWALTHEPYQGKPASNEWRKRSAELGKSKDGIATVLPQSHSRDTALNDDDYSAI